MTTVAERAKEKALEKRGEMSVSTESSIGIGGLRGFDASDLPVPFVKVVQPTSQKVELENGKDAPQGDFFFARNKASKDVLEAVIIDVEKGEMQWEGDEAPTMIYRMLAVDKEDWQPFSIMITGTSRWEWKKFLGVITSPGSNVKNLWDFVTKMTTEKVEGDKGKWYIIKFSFNGLLKGEDAKMVTSIVHKYAVPSSEPEVEIVHKDAEIDLDLGDIDLTDIFDKEEQDEQ